jgi:hypothetical protein
MPIISGGRVQPGPNGPGSQIFYVEGVPTDANLGLTSTPANGMLAQNVLTGFLYERQAGAWVRIDTV